jgi:hypothetical protein
MHDIIEHYGKVIVALAGALAAVLLTVSVVGVVKQKTTDAVGSIAYEQKIEAAFNPSADTSSVVNPT